MTSDREVTLVGFYEELSRYYDQVFPVGPADMAFLAGIMQGKGTLLDLGCGTGNKSIFFAAGGNTVTGIDSDSGMIEKARSSNAAANISYEHLDMMEAARHFSPKSFGGILCLGNTLVHLDGPEQIATLLGDVSRLLAPHGSFLLQILNYNRILDAKQFTLPVLESEDVIFRRHYEWEESQMHFVTSIEVKSSGKSYSNDITLYPLRREELDAGLQKAGFSHSVYYGGFQGQDWTEDSFVTIALCGID